MRVLSAYLPGFGNTRIRRRTLSADEQYTDWIDIRFQRDTNSFTAFVIDNSTTLDVTWVVQARPVYEDGTKGPTIAVFTSSANSKGGLQTGQLAGRWELRVGTIEYAAGTASAGIQW